VRSSLARATRQILFFRALKQHAPIWLVMLLAVVVAIAGPAMGLTLRYERAAILTGEPWRLVSAHLVHLGPTHLALNLTGLALVYGLFQSALTPLAWSVVLLSSALSTGLGLLLLQPEIHWYVGLSGVLHGLFLSGALAARRSEPRLSVLCLVALAVKISLELIGNDPWQTAALTGGPVVSIAHLYGALGGLLVLALPSKTSPPVSE